MNSNSEAIVLTYLTLTLICVLFYLLFKLVNLDVNISHIVEYGEFVGLGQERRGPTKLELFVHKNIFMIGSLVVVIYSLIGYVMWKIVRLMMRDFDVIAKYVMSNKTAVIAIVIFSVLAIALIVDMFRKIKIERKLLEIKKCSSENKAIEG